MIFRGWKLGKIFALILAVAFVVGMFIGQNIAAQAGRGQIQKWPGNYITIYDRSGFGPDLKNAVLQWDSAGLGVNFVLTDDPLSEVVVSVDPRRCNLGCGAFTEYQGYRPDRLQSVVLPLDPTPYQRRHPTYYMTRVLVHELGHVLGLPHRSGCAIMSLHFERACGLADPGAKMSDVHVCGPLPVDVADAARIYGRRPAVKFDSPCTWGGMRGY